MTIPWKAVEQHFTVEHFTQCAILENFSMLDLVLLRVKGLWYKMGDLVSKETVCCIGGKVKYR